MVRCVGVLGVLGAHGALGRESDPRDAEGRRFAAECAVRNDVIGEMAVEEPVARAFGHPRHRHPRERGEARGHHPRRWRLHRAHSCGRSIDGVDGVIEPVQMHRVSVGREVDDAPAQRVSDGRTESVGARPRSSVDRPHRPLVERDPDLPDLPVSGDLNHEDAVARPSVVLVVAR